MGYARNHRVETSQTNDFYSVSLVRQRRDEMALQACALKTRADRGSLKL
jgi:hypothetical protein